MQMGLYMFIIFKSNSTGEIKGVKEEMYKKGK